MMLAPFGFALLCGGAILFLVLHGKKRHEARALSQATKLSPPHPGFTHSPISFLSGPSSWMAIRSCDLNPVQVALGMHNPKPCSWLEGLVGDQMLFLAPPINGWILIFGSVLPDTSNDVDSSFHFLTNLSRKTGHVQFFEANRAVNHHAWIRLDHGRVIRAYAWAGGTLWNQGKPTRAERDLRMKCFPYCESPERIPAVFDAIAWNTENVPALAARWSLDPTAFDQRAFQHLYGIAGEAWRY